jgi:hypothetical protein
VLGLGMTITVAPLTTTVMNAVAADESGIASGVNNAVSRIAGLLAIAVFGVLMAWAFDGHLGAALQAASVGPDVSAQLQRERDQLAAAALPPGLDAATAAAARRAIGDAFVAGFRWIMAVSAALALASAAIAALFVRGAARPVSR